MKRFRFIGDPENYSIEGLSRDCVYPDDYFVNQGGRLISETLIGSSLWEEEPKYHKDTDLGFYTTVMVQCAFNYAKAYNEKHGNEEWLSKLFDHSIEMAKELIEKLDKQYLK